MFALPDLPDNANWGKIEVWTSTSLTLMLTNTFGGIILVFGC